MKMLILHISSYTEGEAVKAFINRESILAIMAASDATPDAAGTEFKSYVVFTTGGNPAYATETPEQIARMIEK